MTKPIWGLQAAIAVNLKPMQELDFLTVLATTGTSIVRKRDTVKALVEAVVACYRFANHLDISIDDEVREYLDKGDDR